MGNASQNEQLSVTIRGSHEPPQNDFAGRLGVPPLQGHQTSKRRKAAALLELQVPPDGLGPGEDKRGQATEAKAQEE